MEFSPQCLPVPEAATYREKVLRALRLDGQDLVLEVQGEGFAFARVIFRQVVGFRVLDERDLGEYWDTYSEPNGWLWEVKAGGWLELESQRDSFNSNSFHPNLREYFVVDDLCINVMCTEPPEVVDIGASPDV